MNALCAITQPGDRVAVLAQNVPEFVELYYAVPGCGRVLVPLNAEKLNSRRVGALMRKLRFTHGNEGGTHRKGWFVANRDLANLAVAYGIVNRDPHTADDVDDPNVTNVTDGHNVTQQEAQSASGLDINCFDDANALAWQAQAGF